MLLGGVPYQMFGWTDDWKRAGGFSSYCRRRWLERTIQITIGKRQMWGMGSMLLGGVPYQMFGWTDDWKRAGGFSIHSHFCSKTRCMYRRFDISQKEIWMADRGNMNGWQKKYKCLIHRNANGRKGAGQGASQATPTQCCSSSTTRRKNRFSAAAVQNVSSQQLRFIQLPETVFVQIRWMYFSPTDFNISNCSETRRKTGFELLYNTSRLPSWYSSYYQLYLSRPDEHISHQLNVIIPTAVGPDG